MEVTPTSTSITVAKRLWRIVRVVFYMIRKSICKKRLMVDLHLLLKRGKIAGKAIGNLMFHHHNTTNNNTTTTSHYAGGINSSSSSSFSCRHMDPDTSVYNPQAREIEFSCSSTPSYPSFLLSKRSKKHRRNHDWDDDAAIRKAFEILSTEIPESSPFRGSTDYDSVGSDFASPSPLPFWNCGKSPAVVRQLRITDSPFPIKEEEGEDDEHVDEQAEAFIARFYQQLRQQRERMYG